MGVGEPAGGVAAPLVGVALVAVAPVAVARAERRAGPVASAGGVDPFSGVTGPVAVSLGLLL